MSYIRTNVLHPYEITSVRMCYIHTNLSRPLQSHVFVSQLYNIQHTLYLAYSHRDGHAEYALRPKLT
ncbi:hypothetical protein HanRHA438_Chr04g0165871 [Helianthus annuus]|nr:hypothetical protein HanRHA438_Chr04g0165871 [Helianthus annuus]